MALLLDRWSSDQPFGDIATDLAEAITFIETSQRHKLPSGTFDIAASRAWLTEYSQLITAGRTPHAIPVSNRIHTAACGRVATRIYTPRHYVSTIVFVHGGGWVIGSVDTHDHICRWLSHSTESRVISVEYALAPEHPYPTAVTQTADVLTDVLQESRSTGEAVFVAGDSAGANIGGMAILACGPEYSKRIAGFISIYGAYSPDMRLSSHKLYGDGRFGLSLEQMQWFWNLYAPHVSPPARHQITPLGADLSNFVPTLCVAAECDLLLDDTVAFYSALTKAGIDVSLSLWPGIAHGAMHFVEIVDSVTSAASVIIRYVDDQRRKLSRAVTNEPLALADVLQQSSMERLSSTVMTHIDDAAQTKYAPTAIRPVESDYLTSRSRLHGSVAHRIGTDIVAGTLAEGTLLPNEENASAAYGVSRSAYREAIRTLSAKGLFIATPKIGTRIAPRKSWRLLDPDVIAWHFEANCTAAFIRTLFEMRKIVEPSAAALAAKRRDEAVLGRLADYLARMAHYNLLEDPWQTAALDFHHLVLVASGNEMLEAMWPPIHVTLRWSLNLAMSQPSTRLVSDPVADHAKVFECLTSQNAEGALRDMAYLIDAALADTMAMLAQSTEGLPVTE